MQIVEAQFTASGSSRDNELDKTHTTRLENY
jgi:hypothetical protein